MNKKIIILIIMITIGCLVTIGNVSASTTTYQFSDSSTQWENGYSNFYNGKYYSEQPLKIVKDTKLVKKSTKFVKKNKIYYKRATNSYKNTTIIYRYENNGYLNWVDYNATSDKGGYYYYVKNPFISDGWVEYFNNSKTYHTFVDSKAKKGNIVDKTKLKYSKTIEDEGKVYKIYSYKKIVALSSKKYKAIKTTTKKLFGYYKVFNMPNFKSGDYNWKSFKNNWFTIGNSKIGYYINHLYDEEEYNPEHRVYKVSPKTVNIFGSLFFHKKPYSFKVYVKA